MEIKRENRDVIKMQEIGLLVNGLEDWYKNIINSFNKHGRTWLQQSKELKKDFIHHFNELIGLRGYFLVFGYVQRPYSKVMYRFKVDKIISSNQRTAPPDETAPPYSFYDKTQGGCKDQNDFRYQTWLRVIECKQIHVDVRKFINVSTKKTCSLPSTGGTFLCKSTGRFDRRRD